MEQIKVIFYGGTGDQAVGGFADGDALLPALSVDLCCLNIGVLIPQPGNGEFEQAGVACRSAGLTLLAVLFSHFDQRAIDEFMDNA